MIGKSLANDFQYTKLKYKQYLYFSLISPCFFYVSFYSVIYQSLFLVCLLKLVLSLNLIHFYLMYYQDNSTEHHKVVCILHAVKIDRFFKKKKKQDTNKQKYCYSLKLNGCADYSLLENITHYWLNFQQKSNFYQVDKIYPVLLKQQFIKSRTTISCCRLYHYLQSTRSFAN